MEAARCHLPPQPQLALAQQEEGYLKFSHDALIAPPNLRMCRQLRTHSILLQQWNGMEWNGIPPLSYFYPRSDQHTQKRWLSTIHRLSMHRARGLFEIKGLDS